MTSPKSFPPPFHPGYLGLLYMCSYERLQDREVTSKIHWINSVPFQPFVRKVQAFAVPKLPTTHRLKLWALHCLLQVSPDSTVQCRSQSEVCFKETLTNMPQFVYTNTKLKQSLPADLLPLRKLQNTQVQQ